MRRVPFLVKFAVSSGMAYLMFSRMWDKNIYEAELYAVAIRHRPSFDKDFTSKQQL